jgi:DNA topoisomerase-3
MVALILAEKPSVAADLARVLGVSTNNTSHFEGNGLLVSWAVGHLLELKEPESYDKKYKTWKMDHLPIIPEEFKTQPKGKRNDTAHLKSVLELFNRADVTELVNACDAAREGELIFRRIQEYSGSTAPVSRMWMRSMTDSSIQKAWDDRSPSKDFDTLGDAARSRAEADWLIGMNGSRAATLRLRSRGQKGSISIGRVQTPTLAMLVDKELEVLSHEPSPYWELEAELSQGEASWRAKWRRTSKGENPQSHIVEQSELDSLQAELKSGNIEVFMTQKERVERSPLNFDLTTLQKVANQMWNMSAKETLDHAQQLYERYKLTTYPRTDSQHLPQDMRNDVDDILNKLQSQALWAAHAKRLTDGGLEHVDRNLKDSKVSDHHAVIPTGKVPPADISARTMQVYELIVGRFIASFHPNAKWEDEKRKAPLGEGALHAEANLLLEEGWRKVISKASKRPDGWGSVASQAVSDVDSIQAEEGMTKPKSRLKEAGLLSRMENAGREVEDDELKAVMKDKGLGTPATRAETIEKLIAKGLVQRLKGGSLRATPDGIRLVDVLRHIPVEWITSPELTGEMESQLRLVENGDEKSSEYMKEVVSKVEELIERFSTFTKEGLFADSEPLGECRKCSSPIVELDQRYACSSESCDIVYWKRSMGRYFDRTTMIRILKDGGISELHGFVRRADSETYSTGVSLGENGELNFQEKPDKILNEKNAEELCGCSICEIGTIFADDENYGCSNPECILAQGRRTMGRRKMSEGELVILIKEGKTPIFDDFISKRNSPFSACLFLEERIRGGKKRMVASFEFAAEDLPEYSVDSTPLIDDGKGFTVVETATHFEVQRDGVKEYDVPRTVKQRELNRDEGKELIEKGAVGPLEEFISAKGKPFKATLYLDARKQVKFRFEKRRRKKKGSK